MSIAAIICEYNPFHAGHRFQIEEVRRRFGADTGVICLMSGNYVQRGEPAVFDKWSRARTAAEGGADLVLELPITAAVNAAGYFAAGAVDCLASLGGIDYLCFGSEGAETETLLDIARRMDSEEYEAALREKLSAGVSYAKAREQALSAVGGNGACLATPNNTLGVDYLRQLLRRGSAMEPVAIPRKTGLPSASELRTELTEGGAMIHHLRYGERAMLSVLRTLPDAAFEAMPFGAEGLWSKVMKACRRENTVTDILAACKSKRYTMSRIKRMLLCLYLGLSEADLNLESPYLRVLAFNDRGRELLRNLKTTGRIPLISGAVPDTAAAKAFFAMECRATDLYALFAPPGSVEPSGRERVEGPFYLREKSENSACNPGKSVL